MDPITAAVSASEALRNIAALVPPGGTRGARHRQRQDSYLEFERAVHDAESWAANLRLLQQLPPDQVAVATLLDRSDARISALMAAVDRLRLLGNPRPRRAGEELVCLLGALFEAIGPPPPHPRHRRALARVDARPDLAGGVRTIPPLANAVEKVRIAQDEWERSADRFADVQHALGRAHRAFALTARDDLRPARHWHFSAKLRARWWQLWRVPASWPGGFPPPDADSLVARYRAEARASTERQELPPA